MSNGSEACCAIGICCPPAERRRALVTIFVDNGLEENAAISAADIVLENFALAPLSFRSVVVDVMNHWHNHGGQRS